MREVGKGRLATQLQVTPLFNLVTPPLHWVGLWVRGAEGPGAEQALVISEETPAS